MKHIAPNILLINPWITDFSAYNFWIKPIGLLRIASLLKKEGCRVTLIDCLNSSIKTNIYGDGKFIRTKIEKPILLKKIPKNYYRYGIPEEMLLKKLSFLDEKPDLIGITSGMTYWYQGVLQLIEITGKLFKSTPIILGGIYASLCYEHARKCANVDFVSNERREAGVSDLICKLTGFDFRTSAENGFKPVSTETQTDDYPAFGLYPQLKYICMTTSKGCPLRCTYCASSFLSNGFVRRDPSMVCEEIDYWTCRHGITDIAFYDDALLIDSPGHFIPIMKEVIKRRIQCNFHAPNALHVKEIDDEVADLLFRSGFKTIRLGFESSLETTQIETGGKVDNNDFQRSIRSLKRAGYPGEEIGVYIMAGLPGQRVGEVEESISYVRETGARPMLVEYSPTPHTVLFEKAKRMSPFDIENEPLFQNNSIFPCEWEGFTLEDYKRLKEMLRR